jgi:hypothetical protein
MFKNINDIVDRIKKRFNLVSDTDVAALIGMTKTALYNHKARHSIPFEQLSTFCEKEKLSFDWLLTGEEYGKPEIIQEHIARWHPASEGFDLDLIKEIIENVEEIFQKERINLPPRKKAELIGLIYEELSEDISKKSSINERVLKLVKLAS